MDKLWWYSTMRENRNFNDLNKEQVLQEFKDEYIAIDILLPVAQNSVKVFVENYFWIKFLPKVAMAFLGVIIGQITALNTAITISGVYIEKKPQDQFKFKLNYKSLKRFHLNFIIEAAKITKAFASALLHFKNKNAKDEKGEKLTKEEEEKEGKFKDELLYEMSKLTIHSLTMKNFLQVAYNSIDTKSTIESWQAVALPDEVYDYYQPLLNKSGHALVKELQTLTEQKMTLPSKINSQNFEKLWSLFQKEGFKDIVRGKEKTILDIYSKNFDGDDPFNYDEKNQAKDFGAKKMGESYSRGYVIPHEQIFQDQSTFLNDAHLIFPVDTWTKQTINQKHIGIVIEKNLDSLANGAKIGFNDDKQIVYEPDDAFKGDISRAYLYFAIKYTNGISNKKQQIFIDQFPFFKDFKILEIINDWHENFDPVDQYDLNRNQEIFEFQKNRNPFIDIPYLNKWIWNDNYRRIPLFFKKAITVPDIWPEIFKKIVSI